MAKLSKLINTQKTKWFWAYIVIGVLFMITGVILAPFWRDVSSDIFFANWGHTILQFVISLLILSYVGFFLVRKIIKGEGNQVVKVLVIIETAVLTIIAVCGILAQFGVFSMENSAGTIIGLALWLRGTIEVFRAYYFKNGTEAKYPVWWLVVSVIFISVGVAFIVGGFIKNVHILWLVVGILFVIGLTLFVLGFMKKPIKQVKTKAEKSQTEKVDEKSDNTITSDNVKKEEKKDDVKKDEKPKKEEKKDVVKKDEKPKKVEKKDDVKKDDKPKKVEKKDDVKKDDKPTTSETKK